MKKYSIVISFIVFLFIWGWQVAQAVVNASVTVTVNEMSDLSDMTPGDGICDVSANAGDQCSLRAAIEELNAVGPDTTPHHIQFNIAGTGPFTITPDSALPTIVVPMEIDGATQPGVDCPGNGAPAALLIVLDGSSAGTSAYGLILDTGSDGSLIRGLVIGNFARDGIRILSDDNRVRCNHIGLDVDGVSAFANNWNGIFVSANNNIIGGQLAGQRNVISGNGMVGIRIESLSENNVVGNNFVGTTAVITTGLSSSVMLNSAMNRSSTGCVKCIGGSSFASSVAINCS